MGYAPLIVGVVIFLVVLGWQHYGFSDHGWFRAIGGLLVIGGGLIFLTDVLLLLAGR